MVGGRPRCCSPLITSTPANYVQFCAATLVITGRATSGTICVKTFFTRANRIVQTLPIVLPISPCVFCVLLWSCTSSRNQKCAIVNLWSRRAKTNIIGDIDSNRTVLSLVPELIGSLRHLVFVFPSVLIVSSLDLPITLSTAAPSTYTHHLACADCAAGGTDEWQTKASACVSVVLQSFPKVV